jgi:hypothetical protein
MMMTRSFGPLLLVALSAVAGCGRPRFGEVEGTVTIDGKPAEGVMVYFVPELQDGSAGPTSWGGTDPTGHYTLACMNQNQRGASVGRHRVVCNEPERLSGGKGSRVPERYRSPATTPLRFDVREGKQTLNLELTVSP